MYIRKTYIRTMMCRIPENNTKIIPSYHFVVKANRHLQPILPMDDVS